MKMPYSCHLLVLLEWGCCHLLMAVHSAYEQGKQALRLKWITLNITHAVIMNASYTYT